MIMRQTPASGFLLHSKPYRDTSKLCSFFTEQFGLVRVVTRKSIAPFQLTQASLTGKNTLKSLSNPEYIDIMAPLKGQSLYAGLYLNELLCLALPELEPYPQTYAAYNQCISFLSESLAGTPTELKSQLRATELKLLSEHGYEINFKTTSQGSPIDQDRTYHYDPFSGWVPAQAYSKTHYGFSGKWIHKMHNSNIDSELLTDLGRLCRICIDHMVDYKPLLSRSLWKQLHQKG